MWNASSCFLFQVSWAVNHHQLFFLGLRLTSSPRVLELFLHLVFSIVPIQRVDLGIGAPSLKFYGLGRCLEILVIYNMLEAKNPLDGTQFKLSTELGIKGDTRRGASSLPYPAPTFPPEQVCCTLLFQFLLMYKPQTICQFYYKNKNLLKNLPVSSWIKAYRTSLEQGLRDGPTSKTLN